MKLSKYNIALLLAFKKGYRIKNGKIFNPKNQEIQGYIKKPSKNKEGERKGPEYKQFGIRGKKRIPYVVRVHKLVAFQKYGRKIFQKDIVVRHHDGNSINNLEENILIGTQSDNMMDIPEEIRMKTAINASNHIRRFTDDEIKEMKRLHKKDGKTYAQLMKMFNISSTGSMSHFINNEYVTKKT